MRRDPTPAEKLLWSKLRKHQADGLKFRRQMPLGPYIVDFYCSAARLVVELDGVSHIDSPTDESRDRWMQRQGIRILRFSNKEVFQNLEGVVIAITEAAQSAPPPSPPAFGLGPLRGPSPQGEGENSAPHRHVRP